MSTIRLLAFENNNYGLSSFPVDTHTSDEDLKNKARHLNLIKYNPNLFTNRSGKQFREMIGGEKTFITTLGCGVIAFLYRKRVNTLRHVSTREGVWFNTFYFLFGTTIGAFYSAAFFFKWQVLFNEYFAHYLLKRYKGSADLNRTNIYALRNKENTDECYHFGNSFINNFHM